MKLSDFLVAAAPFVAIAETLASRSDTDKVLWTERKDLYVSDFRRLAKLAAEGQNQFEAANTMEKTNG